MGLRRMWLHGHILRNLTIVGPPPSLPTLLNLRGVVGEPRRRRRRRDAVQFNEVWIISVEFGSMQFSSSQIVLAEFSSAEFSIVKFRPFEFSPVKDPYAQLVGGKTTVKLCIQIYQQLYSDW